MRLCLDEHYSPEIAAQLRDRGHDVHSVKERAELESLSDGDLLAVMSSEGRALLTENVGDFAPLIRAIAAAGDSQYGVVYSSSHSMPRSRATIGVFVQALDALLRHYPGDDDFRDAVYWLSPA